MSEHRRIVIEQTRMTALPIAMRCKPCFLRDATLVEAGLFRPITRLLQGPAGNYKDVLGPTTENDNPYLAVGLYMRVGPLKIDDEAAWSDPSYRATIRAFRKHAHWRVMFGASMYAEGDMDLVLESSGSSFDHEHPVELQRALDLRIHALATEYARPGDYGVEIEKQEDVRIEVEAGLLQCAPLIERPFVLSCWLIGTKLVPIQG